MPENQIWKKILSQTNIFNVFPLSVSYNTIAKILQSNCRQTTKKYVPAHSMCLNRMLGGGEGEGDGVGHAGTQNTKTPTIFSENTVLP